jgi:hypothetical protein
MTTEQEEGKMSKLEELFAKDFPSNTDKIKFVDPTKKLINIWDLKEITDLTYFDEPLFKEIEIPKELVFFIFKRGFDACVRQVMEDLNENT